MFECASYNTSVSHETTEEPPMQAYRIETTIAPDGSLTLTHLPFPIGEAVEVIVLMQERPAASTTPYSLRGQTVVYHEPFAPVAQDDWSASS